MKIAWSVLIGDARGKAGQVVGSLTRSGHVVRGCFRSKQSNSQAQLEMRAAFLTISQLWADPVMNAYRADWVTLSLAHPELNVFNAQIFKTAHNWFVRCNKNRQGVGESIRLDAPAFDTVGDPGAITAQYIEGPPVEINVSAIQGPSITEAVCILATQPMSMGRLTLSNQQRKIFTELPITSSPWDIGPAYEAKFRAPTPNKNIFVQVRYLDVPQGRYGLTSWCIMDW